jgi:hypothetical protein
MLTVYLKQIPKPKDCFDLAGLPLDELIPALVSINSHQRTGTIWLGYLDGWMLTPHEEVILRKAVRTFNCIVVSCYPLSFSYACKNEIDFVYGEDLNGSSGINDHGGALHDGCKV